VFENTTGNAKETIGDLFEIGPRLSPAGSSGSMTGPLHDIIEPLAGIWHEPLGPMATGLAAVQTVLGLVVFWNLGQEQVVSARFRTLSRERPLPFWSFLLFNLSLALLATYRGYELSPIQLPGYIPAAIAGLIGFTTPVIISYAAHYAIESLTDVIRPAAAGGSIGTLLISGSCMTATAAMGLVGLMLGAGSLFGGFLLFRVIGGAVLLAASLLGELRERIMPFVQGVGDQAKGSPPSQSPIRVATEIFIALAVFGLAALPLAGQSVTADYKPALSHDPTKPYDALVLCLDTSLSVEPQQFANAKHILKNLAATKVRYNDLVWLIEIKGEAQTARLFEMPRDLARRSATDQINKEFVRRKLTLLTAIDESQQQATSTDLRDPVELGLNLLGSKGRAGTRSFVIASDFAQDDGAGQASVLPPQWTKGLSASGVQIFLLVAQPKLKYLKWLGLTPAELFETVRGKWGKALQQIGATGISTQLIDAVQAW
jgi:hypothetical protein